MLIERAELTSGSTWHAAGGMHTVNGDPNVAKLQQYTIELYKEIEEISGQSCGVHLTGGIMLAGTPERLDWLKMAQARGRYLGMDLELISVAEAKKLFPLMDEKPFRRRACTIPSRAIVDPYGVTHAYAKAAQIQGATIERAVPRDRPAAAPRRHAGTSSPRRAPSTPSTSSTPAACGRARSAAWSGSNCRARHGAPVPHHRGHAGARRATKEQLHCIDFEGEIYLRQERGGMLLGTYEKAGVPWSERQTPWDFGQNLLPNDLDRIAPELEVGFEHFPALGTAGIKQRHQRPLHLRARRQPAGRAGQGPAELLGGLRRAWPASARAAASAWRSSNWMVDGDPGFDIWGMDVAALRRLGHHGLHQRQGARELFAPLPHPLPQRGTAGRPAAAHHADLRPAARAPTPCSANIAGSSTRSGSRPRRTQAVEDASPSAAPMRTSTSPPNAGRCARASACSRSRTTASSRCRGPERRRLPVDASWRTGCRRSGRMVLTPDAERARQADRRLHGRPARRRTVLRGRHLCGRELLHALVRAPHARDAASRCGPAPMEYTGPVDRRPDSRASCCRRLVARRPVDRGLPVHDLPAAWRSAWSRPSSGRVSFTGDLGYEIWVTPDYQRALYELLSEAGEPIRPQAVRRPGAERPAAGEGLRHLGARVPARSTGRTRRGSAASCR